MHGIVKHGSEKRDLKLITCGKEKTFQTILRGKKPLKGWKTFSQMSVTEQVEVEEMKRRQARKAREKETRQEEGDGHDEPEEEEVGLMISGGGGGRVK